MPPRLRSRKRPRLSRRTARSIRRRIGHGLVLEERQGEYELHVPGGLTIYDPVEIVDIIENYAPPRKQRRIRPPSPTSTHVSQTTTHVSETEDEWDMSCRVRNEGETIPPDVPYKCLRRGAAKGRRAEREQQKFVARDDLRQIKGIGDYFYKSLRSETIPMVPPYPDKETKIIRNVEELKATFENIVADATGAISDEDKVLKMSKDILKTFFYKFMNARACNILTKKSGKGDPPYTNIVSVLNTRAFRGMLNYIKAAKVTNNDWKPVMDLIDMAVQQITETLCDPNHDPNLADVLKKTDDEFNKYIGGVVNKANEFLNNIATEEFVEGVWNSDPDSEPDSDDSDEILPEYLQST